MITCHLKELATAKSLNLSQVQKRTGLDLGLVRRYWKDDTESFKRDAIDKLCALLNCTPGDLLEFTPDITGHLTATLDDVTTDTSD